ncbi:arsenate reductase family protein [Dysgonomonas sp. HDW5A]|uniref:arsenate reductase family protein n=1 Tax=Dysgonomonas sp. HDW5A TaxID=2714926 RepID=UPI0014093AE0|nr:arsenate reductase family protein [Dysgonomonas sp. HDW5A]QIK59473.1 arsenate reductase family protein [Dysgonomonas sp. HDW5A]
MNKILFLQYPKCSTCQKAAKWLKENNIEVESRHIVENNPTIEELTTWIDRSKLPISKFFNTSGNVYKEQNLKEKVKTASNEELIKILASNGMVVKRPLVIGDDYVLVGFKEDEWADRLK